MDRANCIVSITATTALNPPRRSLRSRTPKHRRTRARIQLIPPPETGHHSTGPGPRSRKPIARARPRLKPFAPDFVRDACWIGSSTMNVEEKESVECIQRYRYETSLEGCCCWRPGFCISSSSYQRPASGSRRGRFDREGYQMGGGPSKAEDRAIATHGVSGASTPKHRRAQRTGDLAAFSSCRGSPPVPRAGSAHCARYSCTPSTRSATLCP